MGFGKRIAVAMLAFAMGTSGASAQSFDPTGLWEASDGESRYEVSLCGDGTQLCTKLVWIRPDVINDRNKQYLNTWVVNGAKRHSDREWRGTIHIYGVNVNGSIKRIATDQMRVKGCALLILCENKTVTRIGDL